MQRRQRACHQARWCRVRLQVRHRAEAHGEALMATGQVKRGRTPSRWRRRAGVAQQSCASHPRLVGLLQADEIVGELAGLEGLQVLERAAHPLVPLALEQKHRHAMAWRTAQSGHAEGVAVRWVRCGVRGALVTAVPEGFERIEDA